jgi:hypothetical protein
VDERERRLVEDVVLLVEEREEARLLVLDRVDLDAVERRQALAAQRSMARRSHSSSVSA